MAVKAMPPRRCTVQGDAPECWQRESLPMDLPLNTEFQAFFESAVLSDETPAATVSCVSAFAGWAALDDRSPAA
jgi:hypothetical protein